MVSRQQIALQSLPGIAVVGLWIALIPSAGGYFPRAWYPSSLFALALLVATVVTTRSAVPANRSVRTIWLAFIGFVAWQFLSISWAESPGSAVQAANEWTFVLLCLWVVSLVPWTAVALRRLFLGWSVSVALACGASLVFTLTAADIGDHFVQTRFADPLGYPNASAALAVMAVWPALLISCHKRARPLTQAVGLTTAVFLAGFAVIPQCRAAVLALVIVLAVALLLSPAKLRLLIRVLIGGIALGAAMPAVLSVFDDAERGEAVHPVLQQATLKLALFSFVAGGVLFLGVLLSNFLRARARARGNKLPRPAVSIGFAQRLLAVRWVWGLTATVVVASVAIPNAAAVDHWTKAQWHLFKSGAGPTGDGSRLLSLAPFQRVDYWTTAVNAAFEHPVTGIGAGNFELRYTAERHFEKHARYTHNIWLQTASETGFVGLGLLVLIVGATGFGVLRIARGSRSPNASGEFSHKDRDDQDLRWLGVATISLLAVFWIQVSFDWLEKFPVLVAPAIVFPAALLVLRHSQSKIDPDSDLPTTIKPTTSRRGLERAAICLASTAIAFVLLTCYLSQRLTENAVAAADSNPAGAQKDLRRAANLNPLAIEPHLSAGFLALKQNHLDEAQRDFTAAANMEPSWVAYLELSVIASKRRDFALAMNYLARARALNRRDPIMKIAADALSNRRMIDNAALERLLEQSQVFKTAVRG